MSLFGNGCGCGSNNGCGLFNGNDTILWFIILFLLIFCNNGCSNNNDCGYSNNCGCNNDCC